MPETENDKTVELDVTGPGASVELPEIENDTDKTFENEVGRWPFFAKVCLLYL